MPLSQVGSLKEVPSFRTEFSNTFVGANGVDVARVYSRPVNYRAADGSWDPIDDSLVASGAGYANRADSYKVFLPSDAGSAVRMTAADGAWASLSIDGTRSSSAKVSGSTATYANVLPGVSLSETATSRGLETSLSLSGPNVLPNFKMTLDLSVGLRAVSNAGSVLIEDRAGSTVFSLPAPVMSEQPSKTGTPPWPGDSGSVAVSVADHAGGAVLTYTPDQQWLQASGRRFPVVLDPSIAAYDASMSSDCTLVQQVPSSSAWCGQGLYDYVGYGSTTSDAYRTLLSFPGLSSAMPADAEVLSASVKVYVSAVTGPTPFWVVPMTKQFTPEQGSWTYSDTATATRWTWPGGDYEETSAGLPVVVGNGEFSAVGYSTFDLTAAAQAWVDGSEAVPSVMIAPVGAAGNIAGFDSLATGYGPYLQVDYSSRLGADPGSTVQQTKLSGQMSLGVNVANGDAQVSNTDLSIAGTGLDETIGRSYNSLSNVNSWFGYGWGGYASAFPQLAAFGYDSLVLEQPDGNQSVWDLDYSQNGSYIAPPGEDAELCSLVDPSCQPKNPNAAYQLAFDTGGEWDFASNGVLIAEYDANGNEISYSYNSNGTPASINDTHGRVTNLSYDSTGLLGSAHDVAGNRTVSYTQNASDQLTGYTDAAGQSTSYAYNAAGLLSQITDPDGDETKLTYDSTGRVLSVTRVTNNTTGAGDTTTYAYYSSTTPPPAGLATCGSPPAGGEQYGYTVETTPDGHLEEFCYDTHDRVYQSIDQAGNRTTTTYNADDEAIEVDYPALGGQTPVAKTTYDTCFRETESVGATTGSTPAPITTTGYDEVPSSQDPYATAQCAEQPGVGYQPTSTTNPSGREITYSYDGHGNLTSETDGLPSGQNTLSFTYLSNGEMSSSTTANGNTTTYGYTNGDLTSVTPPGPEHPTTYTYDADSRMTSSTDGDGNTTTYAYDPLDEVTSETYAGGASTTNTYDPDGNLTSSVDSATGTTSYVYDHKNRLVSETDPGLAGEPSSSTTYGYDGDDNMTSLTDGGGMVTYAYNDDDLPISVTDPLAPAATQLSYNVDNELICTTYPNGTVVQRGYDPSGDVTSIQAANGSGAACNPNSSNGTPNGNVFEDYSYDYDNSGDANTGLRTGETINGTSWEYTYDALDRLSEAQPSTGTTLNYHYDGDGNIQTRTNPVTGATESFTYNADDEITSPGYTYDTAGNLLNRPDAGGTTGLAYNQRNQTTSINPDGTGAQPLSYNGDGQNHPVQIGAAPTGGTPPNLTENALGIASQTTAGSSSSPATTTYYTRAPDGTLLDERTPSGTYDYVQDANGSTIALTNSTGGVANTYTYDPYGVTTSSTGTAPNSFGFDSGFNAQGGLILFGTRYYDPNLGRWTQPDPDALSLVTDPTQANQYSFAGGDPVNATDYSGLREYELRPGTAIAWGIAIEIAGIVGKVGGSLLPDWLRDVVNAINNGARNAEETLIITGMNLQTEGFLALAHPGGRVTFDVDPIYAFVGGLRIPIRYRFTSTGHWEQLVITPEP